MKFKKYPEMMNVRHLKTLDYIRKTLHPDMIWQVTEKIHGANLSFWITENEIKVASRGEFLEEGRSFFGWQKIYEIYKDSARKLFDKLSTKNEDGSRKIQQIVLFGEIFGGYYNHPDIKRLNGVGRINKGVTNYIPDIDFLIFDMMIDGHYITAYERTLENVGFKIVPILYIGKLEDCLKHDNNFLLYIPILYDLPFIEGNICEGTVIKPISPCFLPNGNRVFFKNKNDKYHKQSKTKVRKSDQPFDVVVGKLLEETLPLITTDRLQSVISKMGEITWKDFGKTLGLFSKDVLVEWEKITVYDKPFYEDKQHIFNKQVNFHCANLLRGYLEENS